MKFDFIKPDALCIYDPNDDWGVTDKEWHDPIVVRIGPYLPYYTDDRPTPTSRDEWDETLHIEVYHNNPRYEYQLPLYALHPIEDIDLIEISTGDDVRTDIIGEYCGYMIVGDKDDISSIEVLEDWFAPKHFEDLDYDQLIDLYNQICCGSIYLADYRNSIGVTSKEVYAVCEDFERFLVCEYEDVDAHYNAKEFADFVCENY